MADRIYGLSDPVVAEMLREHGVSLLLDVGAARGEFASELFAAGFEGEIVSFEPQEQEHRALSAAAALHSRWHVAERCALGGESGRAPFHVLSGRGASSLLPFSPVYRGPREVRAEEVPVRTLDEVAASLPLENRRCFLKLDVQGSEHAVLEGGRATLPRLHGLQVELSYEALYQGALPMSALLPRIEALGFRLWHLTQLGVWRTPDGRRRGYQCDAVFFRG